MLIIIVTACKLAHALQVPLFTWTLLHALKTKGNGTSSIYDEKSPFMTC